VVSHGGRSQGFGGVQRGPVCLRKGEVTSYSFDVENGLLHVHVPGLHVGLQYDTSPGQGGRLEGRYYRIKGNRCNWRSSVSLLCIAVKVVGRRLWTRRRVIGWRNLLRKVFFSPRRAYCLSRGPPYCDFVRDQLRDPLI